jgi:hypothetical protein
MNDSDDYVQWAQKSTADEFAATFPFYFLVGLHALKPPSGPTKTDTFETVTEKKRSHLIPDAVPSAIEDGPTGTATTAPARPLLVQAVRKVQETFPSMITVGRTRNNDIVIPDVQVSRFHAFFKVFPDRVELGDAGSANGTYVGGRTLTPKGPTQIVIPGETVEFSHLPFVFVDAKAAWDRIRAAA